MMCEIKKGVKMCVYRVPEMFLVFMQCIKYLSACLLVITGMVITYLLTHIVYQYKIYKKSLFGGIRPYRKTDTGKHNFHEILLLF